MTKKPRMSRDLRGRLLNYANNPLTMVGIVLTTVSALLIVIFTLIELASGFRNPYVGILAFLILPAIFVIGLILIPPGMLRRRQRLRRSGATEVELSAYPKLDFNNVQLRRVGAAILGLTALNAVILGASSFLAVEHMDTVEFCGEACHTVMQPEYTAYQQSPHSRVACVKCHIGPGASWFVRSKVDGLRQVWHTTLGTFSQPITTPIVDLRPARETCEQCHWPEKHHGDKLRIFSRYAEDEANTPSYTALVLKTGGGSLDLGQHGGIHWWHIYSDNRIRYYSSDTSRLEIAWVELVTADGEQRVYTRDGEELPPEDVIEDKVRVMDCIDCHNRPTHLFNVPSKAMDGLLERHPELRDLPYFKRQAVAAIEAEYPTHSAGVEEVRSAIERFYTDEVPDLAARRADLVEKGAAAAAGIYGRSAFPEMKTNWETHPNHIGHDDFPGCWRCHDGEMATADGEHMIPIDCENCHVFLVEDSPTPPVLAELLSSE